MREPRPKRAGIGPGVVSNTDADRMIARQEQPSEVYPLRQGGRATPDRSRDPLIGPACYETGAQARAGERVVVNPETSAGPALGPVENLRARQEHS
jgi:hypothetical protein